MVSASSRRCVRPVRPGCTAEASISVPTTAPGLGRSVYGVPSTVAVPEEAGTRPVIIRIVVVLPAPFGPRKPVTVPGSRVKDTWSTTVRAPYCLVSPLTSIMRASARGRSVRPRGELCREGPGHRVGRTARPEVTGGRSNVIRKLTRGALFRATRAGRGETYAPRHEASGAHLARPPHARNRARVRPRPAQHGGDQCGRGDRRPRAGVARGVRRPQPRGVRADAGAAPPGPVRAVPAQRRAVAGVPRHQ